MYVFGVALEGRTTERDVGASDVAKGHWSVFLVFRIFGGGCVLAVVSAEVFGSAAVHHGPEGGVVGEGSGCWVLRGGWWEVLGGEAEV